MNNLSRHRDESVLIFVKLELEFSLFLETQTNQFKCMSSWTVFSIYGHPRFLPIYKDTVLSKTVTDQRSIEPKKSLSQYRISNMVMPISSFF